MHIDQTKRKRGLFFVGFAVACAGVTMAMQMGLNANFLKEDIGVSGLQLGLLEAIRESCGIWALGLLALLAGLPEPIVGAASLLFLSFGIGAYTFVPNYHWVILVSLIWSQGLHIWMPLPQAMVLSLSEKGKAGYRLGQIHSAGSAGFGLGILVAFVLTKMGLPIRPLYLVAGTAATMAAASCLGIPRDLKTKGPRLVFKREYSLYYLLSFLEGWRKQIFICFAGFLLVERFGTPVHVLLSLYGLVRLLILVAAPAVGRLIDHIGERSVLIFYFACLAFFFTGYAFINLKQVLYVIFVVDSAFFVFTTALTTYVHKIVPASEQTPTLSMGVAMNHVAAVTMPFLGGLLWTTLGHQWTFLTGAGAALISVTVCFWLPKKREPNREAAADSPRSSS